MQPLDISVNASFKKKYEKWLNNLKWHHEDAKILDKINALIKILNKTKSSEIKRGWIEAGFLDKVLESSEDELNSENEEDDRVIEVPLSYKTLKSIEKFNNENMVTLELVPDSELVYENEDSLTGSFVGGFDTQCLSDVESLNQDNPAPIRSNSMPLKKKTPTLKIIPTGKPPKKQLKITSFLKRSSTAPTV